MRFSLVVSSVLYLYGRVTAVQLLLLLATRLLLRAGVLRDAILPGGTQQTRLPSTNKYMLPATTLRSHNGRDTSSGVRGARCADSLAHRSAAFFTTGTPGTAQETGRPERPHILSRYAAFFDSVCQGYCAAVLLTVDA